MARSRRRNSFHGCDGRAELLEDGLVLRHSGDIAGADISPMLAWPRDRAALRTRTLLLQTLPPRCYKPSATSLKLRDVKTLCGSTTDPQGSNL
jgi:hypothetical protein